MKMSDKRPDERPREKLAKYGPGKLSDYELLMAIIGRGDGVYLIQPWTFKTFNQNSG